MQEQIGNIHIVGTSHIAKESIDKVKNAFLTIKPEVICVELDKDRFIALTTPDEKKPKNRDIIRNVGLWGFMFYRIAGYVQKKLSEKTGVKPGSDMLEAIKLAHINQVKLALIDQHISVTLSRFSKAFTFKTKMRVIGDIFSAPFSKKLKVHLDLNRIPDDETIAMLLDIVKKRYPTLYNVMIEERNIVMGKRLVKIMQENPGVPIMAVVGAGHEKGMKRIIEEEIKKQSIYT